MTVSQADEVSEQALSDGDNQLLWLGIVLAVALLVVIASIWWARRQSAVLVDNALVTRLGKLRADARDLVDVRLPEMVGRLRTGEVADSALELPELAYGNGDEIDQVATAITGALRQAVNAATGEAQARNALNTVFRGIARRNQLPLYNLLSLLDGLEQSETNSDALERLYRLDHEATRARRNSENLIILSGGSLGNHLPGPVRMRDVLRSAISETHEYQRVKLKGAVPDVAIASDAVTGLIHLIAELLENAVRFSPPTYEVLVRSMPAQAGVIVEVEDRGLGMPAQRRERVNELLADPPEVDVMAIGDGSQLGFWVIASLVKRFGFRVALRESDYGGILAIVRIPNQLVVTDAATPQSGRDGFAGRIVRSNPYAGDVEATTVIPRIPALVATGRAEQTELPEQNWDRKSADTVEPMRPTGIVDDLRQPGETSGYRRLAAERAAADGVRGWPSESDEDGRSLRSPLPQRSPGDHLNPRLTAEHADAEPDGDDGVPVREIGTALSAFQRGSEAGRHAGDS
jgi:signal transduction histidine kinase